MTYRSKILLIFGLAILIVTVRCEAQSAAPPTQPASSLPAPASATSSSGETARILVGVAQAGTPQASPTQHLFADFYFSRPLPVAKLAVWGDVRLASAPRTIDSTIVTVSADLAKTVLVTPLYQLVQSSEFLSGLEYTFASAPAKTSIAAIGSFGATAPIVSSPNNASASVPLSRFPRQYWAGLRFASTNGTPHVLDATLGQNEVITGGVLHGPVIRVHGEYGLALAKAGTVYLMGDVQLAGARGAQQSDLYRLGIAFDFLQILKASSSN